MTGRKKVVLSVVLLLAAFGFGLGCGWANAHPAAWWSGTVVIFGFLLSAVLFCASMVAAFAAVEGTGK